MLLDKQSTLLGIYSLCSNLNGKQNGRGNGFFDTQEKKDLMNNTTKSLFYERLPYNPL